MPFSITAYPDYYRRHTGESSLQSGHGEDVGAAGSHIGTAGIVYLSGRIPYIQVRVALLGNLGKITVWDQT